MFLFPPVTTTLSARPQVAAKVLWGLSTGQYERVGGVIRHAKTKRIVAWLRDTGVPINAPALGPLMQLNAATALLNLSVTTIGFEIVRQRLAAIERDLGSILEIIQRVDRKIDLGFYANFQAALQSAKSAFTMQDDRNRRVSANLAINRFLEAEHYYLGMLDEELEAGSVAVSPFLNTLTLACVTVARCYLEMEEVETARQHLQEGSDILSSRVQEFYTSIIGVNPAIYLHPQLANSISLERMTHLLRYEDPTLTETVLFETLRSSLWDTANTNPDSWLKKLPKSLWQHSIDGEKKMGPVKQTRSKEEKLERLLPRLANAFSQVEQAIESASCLQGFQIELDYLLEHDISFTDWRQIEFPATSQDDPLILLIPQESGLLLVQDDTDE